MIDMIDMTASCTFTVFCTFIKKRWNNAFFVPSVQGQVRDGISSDNMLQWYASRWFDRWGDIWGAPSPDLARAKCPPTDQTIDLSCILLLSLEIPSLTCPCTLGTKKALFHLFLMNVQKIVNVQEDVLPDVVYTVEP